MCYSALVNQNLKQLKLQFKARVDTAGFKDLFESRLNGNKITIPKALEHSFTEHPETSEEKKIRDLIFEYHQAEFSREEQELFKQKKRLADAERKLKEKPTKKATEDQRIATNKIDWIKSRMEWRKATSLTERDSRIFPMHYAPVIRDRDGERIIEPRRYLLRPQGQAASFDQTYNGCYNAREESLDQVFFWKPLFGKNHAVIVMTEFFENVSEHTFQKRALLPGEKEKNVILKFTPRDQGQMLIPCLFDDWQDPSGASPLILQTFALITTTPTPEIAATGHNRSPIFLREDALSDWLNPGGRSVPELRDILSRRQTAFYEHSLVA